MFHLYLYACFFVIFRMGFLVKCFNYVSMFSINYSILYFENSICNISVVHQIHQCISANFFSYIYSRKKILMYWMYTNRSLMQIKCHIDYPLRGFLDNMCPRIHATPDRCCPSPHVKVIVQQLQQSHYIYNSQHRAFFYIQVILVSIKS